MDVLFRSVRDDAVLGESVGAGRERKELDDRARRSNATEAGRCLLPCTVGEDARRLPPGGVERPRAGEDEDVVLGCRLDDEKLAPGDDDDEPAVQPYDVECPSLSMAKLVASSSVESSELLPSAVEASSDSCDDARIRFGGVQGEDTEKKGASGWVDDLWTRRGGTGGGGAKTDGKGRAFPAPSVLEEASRARFV